MTRRKLTKVGNSLGIISPKGQFVLAEGASVSEMPLRVDAHDPEFKRHTRVAESILKRYRNAFRQLAK